MYKTDKEWMRLRDCEKELIRLRELYGIQQHAIESVYQDYVQEFHRAEEFKKKYKDFRKYYYENVVNVHERVICN